MFVLSMPAYLNMVAVIGPSRFPSPEDMVQILDTGEMDGILVPPAIIDAMCRTPSSLNALRRLKYVNYAGAPLSAKSADLLTPYTRVAPSIGSTEGGGYFTKTAPNKDVPYDYVAFHDLAGGVFEHLYNGLHELVFVRQADPSIQQIFFVYPDRDRYETKDLWMEHPTQKGYWKIVGRTDDYVYLSHGDGLHASLLEPEIEAHPAVRAALIGGHGRPAPVLIVQLYEEYESSGRGEMVDSLRPYINMVNQRCHDCVKLSPERVIFATKEKPFVQTVKGSVARGSTLAVYEDEIEGLFS
jgi:acyl-coenzyme A synthetase/AMP-(fatty) acid ligase